MRSIFSRRLCQMITLTSTIAFSSVFGIACSMGSKRLTNLLQPMAKLASMYRLSDDLGIVKSRYCAEEKRGKCKKYAYYEASMCSLGDWNKLKSARMVLVPITEL